MYTVKVKLNKRSYNIIIGNNIMGLLGKYLKRLSIGNYAYVITNSSVKNKYGRILDKGLKDYGFQVKFRLTPDTEKSKSIEMSATLIKDIAHFDKKKRIFIIAFGGGVIGDLAGFVASIYKRGVNYIQIPTTLLAQVDSSIGGKTAVDLTVGKNLVGAFYQPRLVFSDINFLKTLDLRQTKSGIAEVIKYALINDSSLFNYLGKHYKDILSKKGPNLEFIVRRCSLIKAKIVSQDEREEKGIRTILNFGHTIGHAIEAAGDFKRYTHGEAVAVGMLVASDISMSLGLINSKTLQSIEKIIKSFGLPTKIKKSYLVDIIEAHFYDKKFIGPKNRFVLIEDIGKTKILENIPLRIVKEALIKRAVT